MYEIVCLTPCKVIILGDKTIPPVNFFDFDPSAPPPPPYSGTAFGGGGGGVRSWLACSCYYASIQSHAQGNFFLLYGPPHQWRGPGLHLQVPWLAPMAPYGHGVVEKLRLLGNLGQPP